MWEEVREWLGWIVGGVMTGMGYLVGWNKSSSEAFNQRIDALMKIIEKHEARIDKLEQRLEEKEIELEDAYQRIKELEAEVK